MMSILEQPAVRQRAWPISVDFYHTMIASGLEGAPVELIRGFLVQKMPKSPLHTALVDYLYERIKGLLAGLWVRKEDPLTLIESEPEPDVSVVVGRRADYADHHPPTAKLVIEVAITSDEIDRLKGIIYEEAGVDEYWIVFGEERVVEVHSELRGGTWRQVRRYGEGETVHSSALPELTVSVDALFVL